jgi:hypothetical protein
MPVDAVLNQQRLVFLSFVAHKRVDGWMRTNSSQERGGSDVDKIVW